MIFIVVEKAYENVPRDLFWQPLRETDISKRKNQYVIYSENKYRIKAGNQLSREMYTTKWLIQGCCVLPFLSKYMFRVCLSNWAKECKTMEVLVNLQYWLKHLVFADNQVIITQESDDEAYITRKRMDTKNGDWIEKKNRIPDDWM